MVQRDLYYPIAVGRWQLPVVGAPHCPRLGSAEDGVPDSLAYVVNGAVEGRHLHLLETIRAGDDFWTHGTSVERPQDEDESEDEVTWLTLTGEDLGDDILALSTMVSEDFLVPRGALIEIIEALISRREAWTPPPTPEDLVTRLEYQALKLDHVISQVDFRDEMRRLLHDLDEAGLFDASASVALSEESHPYLTSYVSASRQLTAYYNSRERAKYLPPLESPGLIGAPVSIEWFRNPPPTPAGSSPLSWVAFYEKTLHTSPIDPSGEWATRSRIGGRWYYLRFRWEVDGRPSLTWAHIIEPNLKNDT